MNTEPELKVSYTASTYILEPGDGTRYEFIHAENFIAWVNTNSGGKAMSLPKHWRDGVHFSYIMEKMNTNQYNAEMIEKFLVWISKQGELLC